MRMGRSPLGFHGKKVSKKDRVMSREPGDGNCRQTEGYLSLKQKKRKLSHCEGLELSYETALLRFRVELCGAHLVKVEQAKILFWFCSRLGMHQRPECGSH